MHVEAIVIGAGWHPHLFRLEAHTLLDSEIEVIHPHALTMTRLASEELSTRSSLIAEILSPAGIVDYDSIDEVANSVASEFLDLGVPMTSIAVRGSRSGDKPKNWSTREISGKIGAHLLDAGWNIDLTNPEVILRVHLLAPSESTSYPDDIQKEAIVTWGITTYDGDDWSTRTAPNRPFFKPISLDPKLARTMVNLACPNQGELLDPFCGTGGLVVEGILCNLASYGSDLAWPMVTGTRENVQWAQNSLDGTGTAEIRNASATALRDTWSDKAPFSGFAFDPPYGRNAWKSDDGYELLDGALQSCADISSNDARLVTLLPWSPDFIHQSVDRGISFGREWSQIESLFISSGWQITNTVPIRVHRSLSRLLVLAERK
ncbi:MAG: hypothetical protein VX627_04435 [Candidatus Thermoplasmatota archaeon]|nr:hypothetical protein [Candidatus Thermoplasmatota archaeon]